MKNLWRNKMIKVNNQERYVFGILEIAMVVRDTLEYFVANPQGYDVGKYQARREILKNMTASNSPFYSFCAQNGLGYKTDEKGKEVLDESGKKIKNRGQLLMDNLNDLFETVYGEDARFVRVIDKKLTVDPSYFVPVLSEITGIRETFNDVIDTIVKTIDKTDATLLDEKFKELITLEAKYARAIQLRIISLQLNTLFLKFNNDTRNYIKTLRETTSIDPTTDPSFKPTDDPTVALDNNEMGKVLAMMRFTIDKSKTRQPEPEFQALTDKMTQLSGGFAGNPKITNLEEFMKEFAGVFIPIINEVGAQLTPVFAEVFESIREYEVGLKNANGETVAQPAHEPASSEEKLSDALKGDETTTNDPSVNK